MPKKTFQVEVELHVNSVSCPGVWLCPHGRLSLQIYMLDSCVQTASLKPVFPLVFNEKYVFHKNFSGAQRLSHLQNILNDEYLYAELVQWDLGGSDELGEGGVLASFRSPLSDILFSSRDDDVVTGAVIDLLMIPVKAFPGILSPKIEVSANTTIKQEICSHIGDNCESWVVNTKVLPSQKVNCHFRQYAGKQKKVCHSSGYHRSRKCFPLLKTEKPTFAFRKADDNLIMRKPQGLGPEKCHCCDQYRCVANLLSNKVPCDTIRDCPRTKISNQTCSLSVPKFRAKCYEDTVHCKAQLCVCGDDHQLENCPVCAKYKYYFDASNPAIKSRNDYCSRKCFTNSLNNVRDCCTKKCTVCKDDCTRSHYDDIDTCHLCPPPAPKLTLAERMHERLQKSLNPTDNIINCFHEDDRCVCPASNVGDFYKNFYKKSKNTCEKYISTPCCT